jgi:hypothetical protein
VGFEDFVDVVIRRRLRNQRLTSTAFKTPAEVVAWFGAMQAQEYPVAKWGIGLRAKGLTDTRVEQAFDDGAILRTHILRPTWHFVAAGDIRWMLALSGPRVQRICANYYRRVGLDAKTLARSRDVIERELAGGRYRSRQELAAAFRRKRIDTSGQRLAFLMVNAELEAWVCSGPRVGKQFTYALLEERAPQVGPLDRDEALAELTKRYFQSHGPATVRDFVWWSGLTVGDARLGIELAGLAHETVGDFTYWFVPSRAAAPPAASSAHLLPIYDEYLIAYKDRDLVTGARPVTIAPTPDGFIHSLIVDGRLAGSWKRTLTKDGAALDTKSDTVLTRTNARALESAIARYQDFLEMRVGVNESA